MKFLLSVSAIILFCSFDIVNSFWGLRYYAKVNIMFFDSTFIMNNYSSILQKNETLKGVYSIKGNEVILNFSDRPKEILKLIVHNDTTYLSNYPYSYFTSEFLYIKLDE